MSHDSDEHIVRYLLGDLPDAEAERLDERSITDDEFALRLRVIENDLVDKYARGGAFDVSLERFDRLHRASPHLREKVRFGHALHALTATSEAGGTSKHPADQFHLSDPTHASHPTRIAPARRLGSGRAPGRFAWWSLAAAAVILLAVAGYLGTRNMRLRDELGQLEARRAAIERENAELQQELERTRAAAPTPRPSSAGSPPAVPGVTVATLILTANLDRREGRPPTLLTSTGATHVDLVVPRDGLTPGAARGRVESVEGASIWSGSVNIPATDAVDPRPRARVPVSALPPGDYLFSIEPTGPTDAMGRPRYYFRVRAG